MKRTISAATVCLLAALTLGAQTRSISGRIAFEAASIRPNNSASMGSGAGTTSGGRFAATNVTLKSLIQTAFKLQGFEVVGGPTWLSSDRYDIVAKPEDGVNPTPDQRNAMLQSLLADRFKLQYHFEKREMSVYALLPTKNPKLVQAADPKSSATSVGRGRLNLSGQSLDGLARILANVLGRTVINKTEMPGVFDIKLEWTPDPPAGAEAATPTEGSAPSIFTAIQEQLGLRLESQKGPVEVFVIDSAEKPSIDGQGLMVKRVR